ncbi:hypothetical protein CHRY9293_00283 [Chryseobacterium potabilaquae]|uniref:Uncharacterized protein n=1 Tax=Chryseobacterium potabilaquae TaxID=2675057 RepID=A0A6N4X6G2_9FLAO|nr:hypothetical protein CHRY9293_00283 [Chryseobacterium potabilaquae]
MITLNGLFKLVQFLFSLPILITFCDNYIHHLDLYRNESHLSEKGN